MDNFEQWKSAATELYSRSRRHFRHGLFDGLDLTPLGQIELQQTFQSYAYLNSDFYNIVPFHSETWSAEFSQSPRAAVLIDNEWPEPLDNSSATVFLNLSPYMSSFKKAVVEAGKFQTLNLGIDPFSLGLWKSCLFKSQLDEEVIRGLNQKGSHCFRITTQSYDMAGASDVQQLALLLASVTQLISDDHGVLTIDEILNSLSFEVALTSHLFGSMAKLTALRLLLARLIELLEVELEHFPAIYASPSAKTMSHREPWNNILKLTAMSSAARMGGADGILNGAFDLFNKKPQGHRVSRNVAELLELESFLGHVDLPAEGSFVFNQMVDELCEKSWQFFGEIENKDGLMASLRSGWIYNQVLEKSQLLRENVRRGDYRLTGSNQYPLMNSLSEEFPLARPEELMDFETWWQSQYDEEQAQHLCDVVRWIPHSLTLKFEKFHFIADEMKRETGQWPQVAIVVEPGLEKSPKLKSSVAALKLGGFNIIDVTPEQVSTEKIALLVASDPDGEFTKSTNDKLSSVPCKIWAGEKNMPGFNTNISTQTDLPELFSILYSSLGRV
ncbi:MAG: methylmalonyl-CoA mutase family protein [Pseudomonadota bacterium]